MLILRGTDIHGCGHFGAPRGTRTHSGIDIASAPGASVYSPVCGAVTKLGYPYADKIQYRYVEITSETGYQHRVFYIEPLVAVGDTVDTRTVIGSCQSLAEVYPGITEHVHYEIKDGSRYLNPMDFV